jgi:hypothetical protein
MARKENLEKEIKEIQPGENKKVRHQFVLQVSKRTV